MTESWTSNPYNKFQCLQMYTVSCPANFTLLRLVNIMHSWRELLLLPLGFKAQLRYFRLVNNSLSGFSTTVWPNVYSQYSFCMLFRSQIFWLTLLHTLIFLGLLNIYISICSKYIKPNIYNSMYLQKKLTCFTRPFLFFRKPLPLRWGATKKHGGTKMSMFSPNQSGVNQLGGWAAWNSGNMVEILPGIFWGFATWSNHSKTTTTEKDKKRRKKRPKNGSLNLQPPGFFSLASHFSPVVLFFRVVFRLPDLSSRQAR